MADFNSSLPVRTENPGDVIVKISDATVPSQQLAVDSSGKVTVKLDDASGVGITSTTIGLLQALDVNVANTVPIPITGTITALNASVSPTGSAPPADATYIGGSVSTVAPTYTTGNMEALSLTTSGLLRVDASGAVVTVDQGTSPWIVSAANLPTTVDTDYGAVGVSTIRTAAEIGNATGAASFDAGATGAQTLRVEANQGAANATPWNENIAQIAGSVPGASNSLPVQISTGSAFVSSSNPLPVIIDPAGAGAAVCDYKDASAIASGASDNHDYTVTSGKTLHLKQIESSGSGKAKMVLEIETGVATGVFTTKAAQFNSTATSNMSLLLQADILVAAGVRVRVVMSNRDLLAQDLYSSIIGFEI